MIGSIIEAAVYSTVGIPAAFLGVICLKKKEMGNLVNEVKKVQAKNSVIVDRDKQKNYN